MKHIALFILLIFFSCSADKHEEERILHFQNKQMKGSSWKLDCRFIPLETTEECLISFIAFPSELLPAHLQQISRHVWSDPIRREPSRGQHSLSPLLPASLYHCTDRP